MKIKNRSKESGMRPLQQLDLFESVPTHEMIQNQKIMQLKEEQDKLRKGFFKRYEEHKKQIQYIKETIFTILEAMEGDVEND